LWIIYKTCNVRIVPGFYCSVKNKAYKGVTQQSSIAVLQLDKK
jgi:hypothetical protein